MPRPVRHAIHTTPASLSADANPALATHTRAPRPFLPVRLSRHDGAARPTPPTRTPNLLDKVVAILSQPGFALRRMSESTSASPQASTPPTPGLEDSIAFALFSQDKTDADTACEVYQSARRLSLTSAEEYTALVNDMWVNPSTGLKASCLTHALMSGNEAVAQLLEAHGAEESYCYAATSQELALVRQKS